MNGFFLAIPVLFVRYGLLGLLNKEALSRAGFFAPLQRKEKIAYWVYQISVLFILIYLIFLKVNAGTIWFYIGLFVYFLGLLMYILSVLNYANPDNNGLNENGLYRLSRNPMYVAYFFNFLGCGLLTRSILIIVALIFFQIASHWIIKSEERWCINQFGDDYKNYMNNVRRYL